MRHVSCVQQCKGFPKVQDAGPTELAESQQGCQLSSLLNSNVVTKAIELLICASIPGLEICLKWQRAQRWALRAPLQEEQTLPYLNISDDESPQD